MAFNGTLLAADIAAREVVGTRWWIPLLAVVVSMVICLVLGYEMRGDLGPKAAMFYERYGGQFAIPGREILLADLDQAFDENAKRIRASILGSASPRASY